MKLLRENIGLRTVDVASRLALSEGTVRNWETGRTMPTLPPDQMLDLCRLYKVSLEELAAAVAETKAQDNLNQAVSKKETL